MCEAGTLSNSMTEEMQPVSSLEELNRQLEDSDQQEQYPTEVIGVVYDEIQPLALIYPSAYLGVLTDNTARVLDDLRTKLLQPLNNRRARPPYAIHVRCQEPGSRPLRIMDLPAEILRYIFEYVDINDQNAYDNYLTDLRNLKTDSGHFIGMNAAPETVQIRKPVAGIQCARLSCKRLCDTSSYCLLRFVNVEITQTSLDRLSAIAQHPIISKGVTTIRLYLGLYSPVIAESLDSFVRDQKKLWKLLRPLGLATLHKQADEILDALDTMADLDTMTDPYTQQTMEKYHPMAKRSHNMYHQLYDAQKVLLADNQFIRQLSEAMACLSQIKALYVTDSIDPKETWYSSISCIPFIRSWQSILRGETDLFPVMPSSQDDIEGQWQEPELSLASLLVDITIAIGRNGDSPTSIEYNLTVLGPYTRDISGEDDENLRIATRGLERFVMKPIQEAPIEVIRSKRDFEAFSHFVKACTHSEAIKELWVDRGVLKGWLPIIKFPDVTASALLNYDAWGGASELYVENVTFTQSELMELINKIICPSQRLILTGISLTTGSSWYEILELLRSRGLVNAAVEAPCGGELGFPDHEREMAIAHLIDEYIEGRTEHNPLKNYSSA
ncbi:hypothetical protein F4778DRAFT_721279 [Xylariomycetidae sp. FL2044]|nr:hypothetical protein F4778DRAFT_721279 [Xylariomycetidae sp. FL2044]